VGFRARVSGVWDTMRPAVLRSGGDGRRRWAMRVYLAALAGPSALLGMVALVSTARRVLLGFGEQELDAIRRGACGRSCARVG
jgi:hypothetical protein